MNLPRAVVVDMDGTLLDTTSILHHVWAGHPDWAGRANLDAFHQESAWCPPIPTTVAAARGHHADGTTVLIVTGRAEKWRQLSETWLDEAEVPRAGVWMRTDGDQRSARIVKAEILAKLQAEYDIIHAYDDDPEVIAMWAEQNIPATVVPGWPTE